MCEKLHGRILLKVGGCKVKSTTVNYIVYLLLILDAGMYVREIECIALMSHVLFNRIKIHTFMQCKKQSKEWHSILMSEYLTNVKELEVAKQQYSM